MLHSWSPNDTPARCIRYVQGTSPVLTVLPSYTHCHMYSHPSPCPAYCMLCRCCFSLPLHRAFYRHSISNCKKHSFPGTVVFPLWGFHLGRQPAGSPCNRHQTLAGPASCQAYTVPYQNSAQATKPAHSSIMQAAGMVCCLALFMAKHLRRTMELNAK